MKVIGIDPGSRVCGYGILEAQNGEVTYLTSGCIILKPAMPFNQRLKIIYDDLLQIINQHAPDVMSVEDVFVAKNIRSAIKLAQAKTAALLAGLNSGLPTHEYTPTKVKLTITGRGRADKMEVQNILSQLFGVSTWKSHDASDAVAIALCHIHVSETGMRFEKEFVYTRRNRKRRTRFTLDDLSNLSG